MKSKFAGLNFDSVEVLTQEEKKKVKGGYGEITKPKGRWACNHISLSSFDSYSSCVSACGPQVFTINNCYYV
ncbi:hypothetical protein DR864_15250 [Runella rosea]|uniref:Uncharacterized protein n=1 Tax=Runella rosea TaxID=2259595 RepID=A0A344TK37_9BACT|nr:hypothetical protein [Runella rosea]AXE19008.1 hypothetical protein DR864_15250 [Runella rosea]